MRSRIRGRHVSVVVAAAITGLAPAAALGVGGPAPGAVTPETVKLPSGPGSVRGLADNASVSAFTGQVEYAVPIELPRGPAGLAPSLSLSYDGSLGNGPLGVGWEISQAGVRRSLRLGVPAYDATDELEMIGLAGGQLVPIGGGQYRVEGQGNGLIGRAVDGGFEIVDPSGMVYRLGTTAGGRKASGSQVATWYLEQVRDVAGQTIDYRYRQDRGEMYLDSIEWGPVVGPSRAFRVELVYQDRADAVVSFRTGFRVETAQRLSLLRIWSNGGVQRVVTLSYDEDLPLSRLAGIRITSADGADAMPALDLHYAAADDGTLAAVSGVAGWGLNQQGTSLFDVDDDGAMDLLRVTASGHSWRRNRGGVFDAARPVPGAAAATLDKVRFLDMTGDSIAEMVWQQGSQWRIFQLARDAAGASWVAAGSLAGATNLSLATSTIADLDGDYRMDVLSATGSLIQVRMGGAAGLAPPVARPAIDPTRTFIQPGNPATSLSDINGDGLADVVYLASGAMYLYLGRGDGTFEKLHDVAYPWTGTVEASQIRLADLDRDGLLDVAAVRAGNVTWHRGLAGGAFDPAAVELPRPAGTDGSVVVGVADANGNGSQDLVWSSDAGMWILDMAGPTTAGMLVAIENGMGQTQSFTYEASTLVSFADEAAGSPWTSTAPISIPVSIGSRLALASGEPDRSNRLDVRDIVYDRTERRFVGFLQSTMTRPDPTDGAPAAQIARQVRRFAPGLGMDRAVRGQVVLERIETGAGVLLRETANDLAAVPVAGLPDQALLRRAITRSTEVRHFEGLASPIVTRTELAYDDQGRVVEERRLGRLDLAGDETTARRRYSDGRSTAGVTDRICEEWLVQPADGAQAEQILSHTRTLFGDATTVEPLCQAGAGWKRASQQYLAEEDRWVDRELVQLTPLGDPIQTIRAGLTRDIEYDGTGLFPAAEIVHPTPTSALRWEMTWDPVLGQPTSLRDPGGARQVSTYDGLGRLRSSGLAGAPAHVHHVYHVDGPRPFTESFLFDGPLAAVTALPAAWTPTSGWRHTVSVVDSAGEALFDATRLDVDRWLVVGRRQRDAFGRTIGVAESYELDGSLEELVDSDLPGVIAVRTTAYDALDRVVQKTLPTGGVTTYAYRALETTTTTDDAAPVTSVANGAGQILRTRRTVNGVVESVEARYDGAGRIVAMRLPAAGGDVEQTYAYDSLGRLTFATDPDVGDRTLDYDDGDRVVAQTNAAGQVVSFAYDGAGRLVRTEADDGTSFAYHYDEGLDPAFGLTASRLAWVDEPTGRVELGYDSLGRQNRLRRTVDGHTAEQNTLQSASGLVLRTDDGDGLIVDIAYDPAGRVTAVGDLVEVEEQDAAGRPLRERYGNGLVQRYERDALGQNQRVRIERAGAAIYDVAIGRNAYGAITQVTDQDGAGLDHTATFTYDGGLRLTAATLGAGPAQHRFAYGYDGLQNMIRREAHGPVALGILTGDYRYGEPVAGQPRGRRQLTSILPDPAAGSPPGALPTTLDYDESGRLVRQGALALDYNGLDQLIGASGLPGGSGTIRHDYGYDGQRVRTIDPDGNETIWFTRDLSRDPDGVRQQDIRAGDRLLARISRVPAAIAVNAVNRTVAQGLGAARALRLALGLVCVLAALGLALVLVGRPRRRAVGALSASRRAPAAATALLGVLGASCAGSAPTTTLAAATTTRVLYYQIGVSAGPSLVTRADGSILEERRYEPFGAAIDAYRELEGGGSQVGPIDPVADPHNALNKQTDPATGWSDHGARWMAPETGRWLTPDPPVKAPDPDFMTSPWALHPYQYVDQNPILFWDPDGKDNIVIEILHKGFGVYETAHSTNPALAAGHGATVFMKFGPAMILTSWLMIAEDEMEKGRRAREAMAAHVEERSTRFASLIGQTIGQHARDNGAQIIKYTPDQAHRIATAARSLLALEGAVDPYLFPEKDWSWVKSAYVDKEFPKNIDKANNLFNDLTAELQDGHPITSVTGDPVCDGTPTMVEVQGLTWGMDPITFANVETEPIWLNTRSGMFVTPTCEGPDQ